MMPVTRRGTEALVPFNGGEGEEGTPATLGVAQRWLGRRSVAMVGRRGGAVPAR
jgi:hypothetical protein